MDEKMDENCFEVTFFILIDVYYYQLIFVVFKTNTCR